MGKSEEQTISTFLRRIERLTRGVSQRTFLTSGVDEFLGYQSQIAKVQRDVQREISATKVRARREKALVKHLRQLRMVRWHARRLGDGVAWIVLLLDRKTIHALAQNARVPLASSEDDGSRGVAVTAANLLKTGWGLPIIHDITDCLRIGDITVTSFGDNSQESFFRTLEVKTSRMNTMESEDGTTVELQVTTIGTEPFPEFVPIPAPEHGAAPIEGEGGSRSNRDDRRLDKQFNRMTKAVAYRTAEPYRMHAIDGTHHMVLESGVEDRSHWPELRRAIRTARKQGYAFFSIDDFLGYGIWYNSEGVDEEAIKSSNFAADLTASILPEDLGSRSSLTVGAIPVAEDDIFAPFLMPFTIYDIPQKAIADILHGRLLICAALNTGSVERALSKAGLDVHPDITSKDARAFKLAAELLWPTGERLYVEIPAPWREIMAAMHEFLGIETIVAKSAAITSVPSKISYSEFVAAGAGTR